LFWNRTLLVRVQQDEDTPAMGSDMKLAVRQLVKSPGFALTAMLTLALGIGANAVVFSVLNAVVLRPVNVPNAGNLYMLQRQFHQGPAPSQSYKDYLDLRDRNHTLSNLVTFGIEGPVGVDTGRNPSTAWPYLVSGNYFDALGIEPYLGRFFHATDEKGYNSAPYVVLSCDYWRTHFHADRGVVGRAVEIDKHPFTILGVAPKGFRGTELFFAPAMWIPMVEEPTIDGSNNLQWRSNHSYFVIGHLKPGVTPGEATADLNTIAAGLAKAYPDDDEGLKFTLARPGLVGDLLGGPARAFLGGLMLLAGLILLAACANLGSLFAARAADRTKEVAMRLALGSRRGLILRQLLTEAVLVALAGGLLGLAGGVVILHALSAWQPIPNIPINVPVNPDARTYAMALGLAMLSGLLFGIVPVRQVMRADPWQAIRTGSNATGGAGRLSFRDLLLGGQIAICAVLVTSSLVAVRGLVRSLHSNCGFDPQHAMVVECDLHMAGYNDDQSVDMQKKMLDAIREIPGVTAAGYTSDLPLGLGGGDSYVYTDTTTDYRPTNYAADAMNYNVSPDYMKAAGTELLAGRDVSMADDAKAPIAALVNRKFADKVFGGVQQAVGGHFKFWGGNRAVVVGVVENGKYRTLTEDQQPAMFFSFLQHKGSGTFLIVRSRRDAQEMAAALEQTMRGLDPGLPFRVMTWESEMASALFAARVATAALGVLGFLGAMLAVTGIFGMASYVVSRRLRELGIRVALGAGQREVLRAALGRAFRVLAIGSAAGVAFGLLGTRLLAHIVYEATPKDPVVLGGVVVTMMALGLVATWIPARRALAVDPAILLREE
jgi:predicted permease